MIPAHFRNVCALGYIPRQSQAEIRGFRPACIPLNLLPGAADGFARFTLYLAPSPGYKLPGAHTRAEKTASVQSPRRARFSVPRGRYLPWPDIHEP